MRTSGKQAKAGEPRRCHNLHSCVLSIHCRHDVQWAANERQCGSSQADNLQGNNACDTLRHTVSHAPLARVHFRERVRNLQDIRQSHLECANGARQRPCVLQLPLISCFCRRRSYWCGAIGGAVHAS